jgi:hypothetical protein
MMLGVASYLREVKANLVASPLSGPQPPDWHAEGRPAPWITPRVVGEGRKLAGASLVAVPMPLSRPDSTHRCQRKHRRMSRPTTGTT